MQHRTWAGEDGASEEGRLARDGGKSGGGGGLTAAGGDFFHLVVDYAKQETLGPLKSLGRFLLFGLVGSIAITAGAVLLLLALLRALQTETGSSFTGHLSWLPYLIVAAVAIAVMGLAAWRITKGPGTKKVRPGPNEAKQKDKGN